MKIVCLLGSPRREGNSAVLATRFLETAAEAGAEVICHRLNELSYRGCQACYACKEGLDRCVLQDDLTSVLADVAGADVMVLASPVYFGEVSGQLKNFIDRTYSFLVPDYVTNPRPSRLVPGKGLVFILTQGHPDESLYADIAPRYGGFYNWYGFREPVVVRACGVRNPGDVAERPRFMRMAEEAAEQVTGSW